MEKTMFFKNTQNRILKRIKNIINHEDFNSPYDWIRNDFANSEVENLLNSSEFGKKAIIDSLIKCYFENYVKRLERLIPLDPPAAVLLNQSECYLDCLRRLNQILEENN